MAPPVLPLEQRFWAKVNKNGPVPRHRPEPGHCWVWTGAPDKDGYGRIWHQGKTLKAHRVGYIIQVGPISDHQEACHRCDNPPCVRGEHLFAGTLQENVADRDAKGRQAKGERNHGASLPGATNPSAKLTDEQALAIRERYALGGISHKQLAEQYGVTTTIIGYITRGGIWKHVGGPRTQPGRGASGEANAAARLRLCQVEEIKRRYAAGERQAALAAAFGVSFGTVHLIIRGRTWRGSAMENAS